jgi:hypothetical protein
LSSIKQVLLLYALAHQFFQIIIGTGSVVWDIIRLPQLGS